MKIPIPKNSSRSNSLPTVDMTDFDQVLVDLYGSDTNSDDELLEFTDSLRAVREESPAPFLESFLEELTLLLESLTQTERPRVGRWALRNTATKPIPWPEQEHLIRARAEHLAQTIKSLRVDSEDFPAGSVEADFLENTKKFVQIILTNPKWVCNRYHKELIGIAAILSSDTPANRSTPAHHASLIP